MKRAIPYIVLHLIILLHSLSSICSKMASSKPFLSLEWCIFYGLVIVLLGVYAIILAADSEKNQFEYRLCQQGGDPYMGNVLGDTPIP